MTRSVPILLVATLATLATVAADDAPSTWPRFRGPNGTGVSQSGPFPARWTAADYAWRQPLPGTGHSSPIVWGERLFVTAAETSTGRFHVVGLRTADGTVAWERTYPLPAYTLHRNNTFATATPAADAARVYLSRIEGRDLVLTALTHTGAPAWEFRAGLFRTEHGLGHSPIVHGDLVIVAQDHDLAGRIVALDAADGRLVWETPRRPGRADYSTPCVHTDQHGLETLVFNTQEDGICGLDARTGQVRWSADDLLKMRSVSSPVIARGLVFGSCGSGGGGNYVVALEPPHTPGTQARLVYDVRRSAPYVPTPPPPRAFLFLWSDGGIATCLRAATGASVWQERIGGNYFASPVCADGKLFGVSTAGEVVVLRAGPTFELLGRSSLGEASHATPAIAGDRLFFRTLSHVICLRGAR